jgi:hypothetical protein
MNTLTLPFLVDKSIWLSASVPSSVAHMTRSSCVWNRTGRAWLQLFQRRRRVTFSHNNHWLSNDIIKCDGLDYQMIDVFQLTVWLFKGGGSLVSFVWKCMILTRWHPPCVHRIVRYLHYVGFDSTVGNNTSPLSVTTFITPSLLLQLLNIPWE